jgi:methyl-galactoside transport system ATP-binding protein
MNMDSQYVLEMKNISKRFPGVVALDRVSLRVRPGTVHALMGENGAGKSTLMKCLFGMYHAEEGEIVFKGKQTRFPSTKDALDAGVSMIHQELANVPDRSVQENIWLGREPVLRFGPFRALRHRKMHDDTLALMKELEMDIRPDVRMGQLSISHQQACEIAKAVSCDASVVVMDEPTSSITEKEADHLFRIIRDLKSRGVAIIYISHKMHEIFQIADEISVMRDGRLIGTHPVSSIDEDQLIRLMVGRDTSQRFPPLDSIPGETRLQVRNLKSANPRSFQDISLSLRRGEILGIGGLVGAQRTEFVEALFGLRDIASGSIEIDGKPVLIESSGDAIHHGVGLITEDRRASGIFPQLSITTNTVIPSLSNYRTAFRNLKHQKIAQETERLNRLLRTKTPSMETPIQNLSGGNQQKVLIARWLMIAPDILIMDEPTRGIDVGAKYEIYSIMVDLVKNGKSIIMVSSEMPELIGMSHRIMVLCEGRYTGTLEREAATQDEIMRLATKYM